MMRTALALAVCLVAVSARAQSAYVVGTIGADVSRVSHTDSNLLPERSNSSEVVSGSLRVGTSVGQAWGVEAEFVRSGRSRGELSTGIFPLPLGGFNVQSLIPGAAPAGIPVSIGRFQTDMRRSHSDLDAVAWVRQRAGGSVDLVYLAGVAFSRERVEITQTFPTILTGFAPVPAGAFRTSVVNYGTRPLVGTEARIGLTSHMRLVPGLRVQGLADGWLLRPYVGLGWFF